MASFASRTNGMKGLFCFLFFPFETPSSVDRLHVYRMKYIKHAFLLRLVFPLTQPDSKLPSAALESSQASQRGEKVNAAW